MTRTFVALIATAALAHTAVAAEMTAQITSLSGKVLVNQGQGFVPAQAGQALKTGDKMFVGKEGAASLHYVAANCTVDVAAATVLPVEAKAPCTEGQTVSAVQSVFINSASATEGGEGGEGALVGGTNYSYIVVPAFAVGTAGLITYQAIKENRKNDPVSAP